MKKKKKPVPAYRLVLALAAAATINRSIIKFQLFVCVCAMQKRSQLHRCVFRRTTATTTTDGKLFIIEIILIFFFFDVNGVARQIMLQVENAPAARACALFFNKFVVYRLFIQLANDDYD